MNTETRTQLIAVVIMIFGLLASGVVAVELTASGGRNRLSYADVAVDGQPPQVAAGIAMGAFRGLFVNFLWIRANNLKEEGRYHEAMDLAKAITTLQPRYPHVWVFHAWNMAYNISVTTQTPKERWDWVSRGIDLLRKEGIPNNPNDLLIHKELGWFFLHKIGGFLDDANLYYKRQLAGEWTLILGHPPLSDTGTRSFEEVTKEFADWLRPIAEAPDTMQELVRDNPRVGELVQLIRQYTQREVDTRIAQRYVVHRTIVTSGEGELFRRTFGERDHKMHELINDPAWQKEWSALLAHLRKRMLYDQYHMEAARMLRYTETYGPMDWRHHGAHGLYWSLRGVENAMLRFTEENKRDFDFVNANRVVVQGLQELWRSGDLYFDFWSWVKDPDSSHIFHRGSPNIHFIESYGDHLHEFVTRTVDDRVEGRHRSYGVYAAGYENFRKDAIRFLYRRGQREAAIQMLEDLKNWPYRNTNDLEGSRHLFSLTIDEFVKEELKESLTRPSVAREEVVGSVQGAFVQGLLAGNDQIFRAQMEYAALVHKYFFDQQSYRNHLDPETLRMAQMDPDFRVLAGQEFAAMVTMLELDDAERLFDNAPRDLKLWGYDILLVRFKEGMEAVVDLGGRSFDQVFPEPEGIEQHRRRIRQLQQERRDRMPPVQMK